MGILFIDGMDHVSVGDSNTKYDVYGGNFDYLISGGRFGQGAYRYDGAFQHHGKMFSGTSSITCGFGVLELDTETFTANNERIELRDKFGATIALLWRLRGGALAITDDAENELCRGSYALALSVFHFIEFHFAISANTGASDGQIMVNGELYANLPAGTDTDYAGTGSCSQLVFGNHGQAQDSIWDDIYILDDSGPVSTFLGEIRIDTLWPTSEGTDGTDEEAQGC